MECSRRKRSCGKRTSSPTKRTRSRLTQFSRLLLYIRNFPWVRRNVVPFPLHRFIWGRFAWRPPLPVSLDWNYRTLVVLIVRYLSLSKYTTAEITHVWFLSPSPILSRNLGNRNWTSQLEVLTQNHSHQSAVPIGASVCVKLARLSWGTSHTAVSVHSHITSVALDSGPTTEQHQTDATTINFFRLAFVFISACGHYGQRYLTCKKYYITQHEERSYS